MKSMPFATRRLSIAVFLSVAGYSPFRAIKASSRATVLQLFVDNGLNPPTYTSPTNLFLPKPFPSTPFGLVA
jgi:hypothetical protein